MDPALLKEREAFKARALKLPTVEKRKAKEPDTSSRPPKKSRPAPKPKSDLDYKSMQGSSQFKFGILAKIVKFMKERHQEGDTYPLTMEEILDETNQLDVNMRLRHWLQTEALLNNPKLEVVEGNKYRFKPKYNIKDRKGLLRLLDRHDQKGEGGIIMEDVEESLPRFQKALKILGDQVVQVTRPIDKKKVLFYNDKSFQFNVDEEIAKLWRGVAVDGVDENKIEEYLKKQGITSMQDVQRSAPIPKRKKGSNKKKNRNFKSHNEHMDSIFKDYSDVKK